MSSHHIVREKQEPALIIGKETTGLEELAGQLLEWSPFVMVTANAIPFAVSRGIKIDGVSGAIPSEIKEQLIIDQHPVIFIEAERKVRSELLNALEYFEERSFPAVNIIGWNMEEAERIFMNLTETPDIKMDLVFIDCRKRMFRLPKEFKKWYPENTVLEISGKGDAGRLKFAGPVGIISPISTSVLKMVLKTKEEGLVTISHSEGDFYIKEDWI